MRGHNFSSPSSLLLSAHLKDLSHSWPEAAVIGVTGEGGEGGGRDRGGVEALHARLPLQLRPRESIAALPIFSFRHSFFFSCTVLKTRFRKKIAPFFLTSRGEWSEAAQSYPLNIATVWPLGTGVNTGPSVNNLRIICSCVGVSRQRKSRGYLGSVNTRSIVSIISWNINKGPCGIFAMRDLCQRRRDILGVFRGRWGNVTSGWGAEFEIFYGSVFRCSQTNLIRAKSLGYWGNGGLEIVKDEDLFLIMVIIVQVWSILASIVPYYL